MSDADHRWLREQITARRLVNCSDLCLSTFLEFFGNRQIALEAIDSVWHGQAYYVPQEGAQ